MCETVVAENQGAYPELGEKQDFIVKVIRNEEEAFEKTIDSGLSLLEDMLAGMPDKILSGADAFRLYDTYGFPVDLTRDIPVSYTHLVLSTWVPPHSSMDLVLSLTTRTVSPYFAPNSAMAPSFLASSMDI